MHATAQEPRCVMQAHRLANGNSKVLQAEEPPVPLFAAHTRCYSLEEQLRASQPTGAAAPSLLREFASFEALC